MSTSRTSNALTFRLSMSDESGAPTKETCEDPYLSQLGDEDYEWYLANRNIRQIP
ncbi:hypothetical protein LINGRAHAP2_LOCUS30794, partial [Linum grandiflorum]